jgi:adenosine deaminase
LEQSVIGWDVAGHEGLFPLAEHEEAIKVCKSLNLPITIHAGEWGLNDEFHTVDNLRMAALYADRIGHALTLTQDLDLMEQF